MTSGNTPKLSSALKNSGLTLIVFPPASFPVIWPKLRALFISALIKLSIGGVCSKGGFTYASAWGTSTTSPSSVCISTLSPSTATTSPVSPSGVSTVSPTTASSVPSCSPSCFAISSSISNCALSSLRFSSRASLMIRFASSTSARLASSCLRLSASLTKSVVVDTAPNMPPPIPPSIAPSMRRFCSCGLRAQSSPLANLSAPIMRYSWNASVPASIPMPPAILYRRLFLM